MVARGATLHASLPCLLWVDHTARIPQWVSSTLDKQERQPGHEVGLHVAVKSHTVRATSGLITWFMTADLYTHTRKTSGLTILLMTYVRCETVVFYGLNHGDKNAATIELPSVTMTEKWALLSVVSCLVTQNVLDWGPSSAAQIQGLHAQNWF